MNKILLAFFILFPIISSAQNSSITKKQSVEELISSWESTLPNLKKPVYLKKDAYVCLSQGSLKAPRDIAISTGTCAINKRNRRVKVHPPLGFQERYGAAIYDHILVSWESADVSDGTIIRVWTSPNELRN